ncbi:MAG: class I SAM-dependent methyltransferase [Proteobacteria bacterium]|nr:class I SAM-dependent methyltransferase [Pseudomonadota bacterium]
MFFKRNNFAKVDGVIVPPAAMRWGGPELKNDAYYLKSAESEALRIRDNLGYDSTKHILDIGCGQGRLPIGILRTLGEAHYTGIDVHKPSIKWCKQYIEKAHPSFQFRHLNAFNERYSKSGLTIDDAFRFDIRADSVDIVYLYSVFTHMRQEEMEIYLHDFKRILRKNGKIFFSAFFEEDVEDYVINPDDFHFKMNGPLHVVRYNTKYLYSILEKHGYHRLDITEKNPRDNDGQQFIYLSR